MLTFAFLDQTNMIQGCKKSGAYRKILQFVVGVVLGTPQHCQLIDCEDWVAGAFVTCTSSKGLLESREYPFIIALTSIVVTQCYSDLCGVTSTFVVLRV